MRSNRNYKLKFQASSCNFYKYLYCVRIVKEWNDLPEWVVRAGNLACSKWIQCLFQLHLKTELGKMQKLIRLDFFFFFKKLSSITSYTHEKGLHRDKRG